MQDERKIQEDVDLGIQTMPQTLFVTEGPLNL